MKWNLKNKDGTVRYGTLPIPVPVPYHFFSISYRIFKKVLTGTTRFKGNGTVPVRYRTVHKKLSTLNPLPMGVRQYYRIVLVPVPYRYLKDDDYHLLSLSLSLSLRYGTGTCTILYHEIQRWYCTGTRYQIPYSDFLKTTRIESGS